MIARNWRVVSASVRGTGHVRTGQPCQDSVYHRADLPDGVLIAAVSDGAGSAARSEIGSALAVRKAVESARLSMLHTSARLSEGYLRDTVRASVLLARSRLEDEARRIGANVRDLSATLLLIICARDTIAAAQIGDGAVVVSGESGGYRLFTTPQRGEYANVTVFLVSRNALESLEVKSESARPRAYRHVHGRNTELGPRRHHRRSARPILHAGVPVAGIPARRGGLWLSPGRAADLVQGHPANRR